MGFRVVSAVRGAQTFAVGKSIRDLPRLRRLYGQGRWRKRKGVATVRLDDGFVGEAELHWYEATGIGKKELRIKRILSSNS
jgi:hypothetical protein